MKYLILAAMLLTGCAAPMTKEERNLLYTQSQAIIHIQDYTIVLGHSLIDARNRIAELERPRYILDSTWSEAACTDPRAACACLYIECGPHWSVDTLWVKP